MRHSVDTRTGTFRRFLSRRCALDFVSRNVSSSAFSLVEIVIAIGIAAFCLVAMLGLIPTGLKSVKSATEQTAATAVLQQVVTDLRSTPPGSNISPGLGLALTKVGASASNPGATIGTSGGGITSPFYMSESGTLKTNKTGLDARYGVSLTMTNPSDFLTTVQIFVWWPSTAASNNAQGSVETVTTILRQ
jgi:type II secretory pathway pseudopilin PulG